MNKKIKVLVFGALIAAIYAAMTLALPFLSYGPIQFRIAEVLTVLPYFTPVGISGLTIGCLLANLFSPYSWLDIVFGTIATAIGATGTYLLGKKKNKLTFWLAPLPTVLSNSIIVGGLLTYENIGRIDISLFLYNAFTVGIGEIVCSYILGIIFMYIIKKYKNKIWFFN